MKHIMMITLLLLCACSNRAMYDNLQRNAQNECRKMPPAQAENCLAEHQQSYDEYKKQREQVVKPTSENPAI